LATCGHGLHHSSNNNNSIKWSKQFDARPHRTVPSYSPGGANMPSYNTCFLRFTRVRNPNGISIASAVFAQLTAECRWEYPDMPFPLKFPLRVEIWTPHLTHASSSPSESISSKNLIELGVWPMDSYFPNFVSFGPGVPRYHAATCISLSLMHLCFFRLL